MARSEEYVGHVWVTVDGQALLETPDTLRDYEVVTTFAEEARRLIPSSPRPLRRLAPVLRIESLQRHFDSHVVLDGIDFEATAGERVAILGPNGSGKTTLLRCIAGTLTATAGSIRVAGHSAGSIEARQLTGASLSQERSFYLRLSGRENLLLFARLNGLGKRAAGVRIDELADELELGELLAQRADRCSSGQLQQLAFARALVGDPVLVLLDEPTRSLDVEARGRLWAALERRPTAVSMIATHLDEDVGHATSVIDLGDSHESVRSSGDRRDRLLWDGGA
jgi:ABC-type multidrug transport system ATPase subunit